MNNTSFLRNCLLFTSLVICTTATLSAQFVNTSYSPQDVLTELTTIDTVRGLENISADISDVDSFNAPSPSQLPFKSGTILFLRTNLHHEKREISAANFQLPGLLALGTEIKVESINRSQFKFQRMDTKEKFVYEYHKQAGENLKTHLSRIFSTEPVFLPEDRLTAIEISGIRDGKVVIGMSRFAVILAIGLPPKQENPDLYAVSWRYWIKRFNTMKIVFDENGLVSEIIH